MRLVVARVGDGGKCGDEEEIGRRYRCLLFIERCEPHLVVYQVRGELLPPVVLR